MENIISVNNGFITFDKYTAKPSFSTNVSNFKNIKIIKHFNANYDPESSGALLDKSLKEWFGHSDDFIELFDQMLGYLLMNHAWYQQAFFFIGPPATGKSTLLSLIKIFCDTENVSTLTMDEISKEKQLHRLFNKTANICMERPNGVYDVSNFKHLISGDSITVKPPYQKPFTFCPDAKFLFEMNKHPKFNDKEQIQHKITIFLMVNQALSNDKNCNPRLLYELTSDFGLSALLNRALRGYTSLIHQKYFKHLVDLL